MFWLMGLIITNFLSSCYFNLDINEITQSLLKIHMLIEVYRCVKRLWGHTMWTHTSWYMATESWSDTQTLTHLLNQRDRFNPGSWNWISAPGQKQERNWVITPGQRQRWKQHCERPRNKGTLCQAERIKRWDFLTQIKVFALRKDTCSFMRRTQS